MDGVGAGAALASLAAPYNLLAQALDRPRRLLASALTRYVHPEALVKAGARKPALLTTAVVLAGGRGTRLYPLTEHLPKPLVPVFGRALLDHLLTGLARSGVQQVYILLGFGGEQVLNHLAEAAPAGLAIETLSGNEPYGTAGATPRLRKLVPDGVLVLGGEALTDADFLHATLFHQNQGALVTVLAKEVPDASQFGLMAVDETRRITDFVEKPARLPGFPTPSGLVSCGMYLMRREALDYVPAGVEYDFGKQLLPSLLEAGAPLYAWSLPQYWRDIGTWEAYVQGMMDVLEGQVRLPWPLLCEKIFLLRQRLARGRFDLPAHPAAAIATLEAEFATLAAR